MAAAERRAQHWTALSDAYRSGIYARELFAKELAAACLVLRDASWAADVFPFCSHGRLGMSIASEYEHARTRRAVWVGGADQSRGPIATFQDRFGIGGETESVLRDLEEATLRRLVDWLHEETTRR